MNGFFFVRHDEMDAQPSHPQLDALKLLAKQGKLEIMYQKMMRGASVWLTPANNDEDIEFFYICSGMIHFVAGEWETTLHAGDCFHTKSLGCEVVLDILEDTDVLYVSTIPVFDSSTNYQTELFNLLRQIDEKDSYTLQHSVNVRNYTLQLWQMMPHRQTGAYGDVVVASLFHDVGKIIIPDSILKKPARFTPEEYEVIKTHAAASGELLSSHFPGKAVEYAAQHHERLDGSGYPGHLTADQLSFESRVIALVDAFDAMTTSRGYNTPKPFDVAALELCSLPHLFDHEIAEKLLELIRSDQLVSTPPVRF